MKRKRKRIIIVIAAVAVLGMPFCSTVHSLREDWEYSGYNARPSTIIYSGVRADFRMMAEPGDCPFPGLLRGIMLLDLPFSACADTICLPYTIYRRLTESQRAWRVVDVVFESSRVRLISLDKAEDRDSPALADICSVLSRITGRPQSVRVNVNAHNAVSTADYGILYETIQSNPTLKLAYQSDGARQLSQKYLEERASNPQGVANGRLPFSSDTNRASAAAASRRSP